jgi:hypothetical protein
MVSSGWSTTIRLVQTVFAALIGGLIAGVIVVTILYLAGVIEREPFFGRLQGRRVQDVFLYAWPFIVIGLGFSLAYVWNPSMSYPKPEFYRASSEVIILLLFGLIIERDVVARLDWPQRLEYGLILLAAEAAALLALSESLPNADEGFVGGSRFWTTALSTFTAAGLLASSVLVVAALVSRGTRSNAKSSAKASPSK